MLFKKHILEDVARGKIAVAFRRWKRPTVKAGGTLRTRIGMLAIKSVELVEIDKITERAARSAGHASLSELVDELNRRNEGSVYRIRFSLAGDDPRVSLRNDDRIQLADLKRIIEKIDAMDRRSQMAWAWKAMRLIDRHPGRRAPDLAQLLGMESKRFKANIRKLKALGLTESLAVGYRLSPRGRKVLASAPKK